MTNQVFLFWIPVLVFGQSMAIDIAIATASRFHDKSLTFSNWALPLGLTHAVLPALSFYVFWLVGQSSQLFLGLGGFVFVLIVVQEIFLEALGKEPIIGLSERLGKLLKSNKEIGRRIVIVMSVSWDAALCGTGLLAEAKLNDWIDSDLPLIFCSFGIIATLTAGIFLWISRQRHKSNFHDHVSLAKFILWGKFLELSVIGGFGTLSLWFGLTGNGNVYVSILITTLIFAIIFKCNKPKLWSEAIKEAQKAIYRSDNNTSTF